MLLRQPNLVALPRFSPDGSRLVIGVGGAIWVVSRSPGAAPLRLTSDTTDIRPEWSPDGKRILYRAIRGGRSSLRWMAADGTGGDAPLLVLPDRDVWQGVLTPDGRTVVFRTGTQAGADIWYRGLTGDTTIHPLATSAFEEHSPRVSPDGKWVAYTSNESGQFEVYVRAFAPGGGVAQVSIDGGQEPIWGRDGRTLYYAHGVQLLRATLRMDPVVSVVSRSVIVSSYLVPGSGVSNFDVSPDGREIALIRPAESTTRLVYVHDWISELRARFGHAAAKP